MTEITPSGSVASAASPGAIDWEEPEFADLTWEWDDMHTPRALHRLSRAYVTVLASGMGYRVRRHELPVRNLLKVVDGYAYFSMIIDAPPDEHAGIREAMKANRRAEIGRVETWWRDSVRPEIGAIYREIDALPVASAGPAELAAAWERAWSLTARIWEIHFAAIVGPYQVLEDLVDLVKPNLSDVSDADILALASGAIDDLGRVEAELDDLTRGAAGLPDVLARLRAMPRPSLEEVRALPGAAAFVEAVEAFLAEHGHLGHLTEDLSEPSWAAEPGRLLADIGIRVERDPAVSAARRARREADADALLERIRTVLADRPDVLVEFERTLATARAIGWLTEGHNYWLDRMCGDRFRRFTRRIGRCLVDAGVIADIEDIREFEPDEVAHLLLLPEDRRGLVAERVAEHARWAALTPPRTIGKAASAPADADRFDGQRYAATDAAILRGTGASAGIARAVARVVHGPDDFDRVRPGDIVVARASNPGWVPLFSIAAGFVTDTGGVLSHAAVVAREFGVPAVVGTGDATTRIGDGRIIEIDGSTGYVRLE